MIGSAGAGAGAGSGDDVDSGGLAQLVVEEEGIVQKRNELVPRLERLEKARRELNKL